ncbi:hypothetical protein BH11PLA1_BH11PLA1_13450 [soil metagenome]
MPPPVRAARLFILVLSCLGSLALALIVASAFSATGFRGVRTAELGGLVLLLMLPMVTASVVVSEQRARGGFSRH